MTRTLDWIKSNIHPEGGLRAWPGYKAYPEVTGYIIPTLLRYEENELARDFADWLVEIQNPDGSFDGLDGIPRTFDTAACMEGIEAAHDHYGATHYGTAYGKANSWLQQRFVNNGTLSISEHDSSPHIYLYRVNGIMGADTSPLMDLVPNRSHYIAYALEGLLNLGYVDYVKKVLKKLRKLITPEGLMPFTISTDWSGSNTDTCATAQVAVLLMKCGMDASDLMDGLTNMVAPSGGLMLSAGRNIEVAWAAKYYLDAKWHERSND